MNHFKKERNKFIILMLMPATILLVGLTFPFIVSFILSFTDYSLLRPGQTKFIFWITI